jgi:tetratricopeptide (TPR) repeat protein
MEYVNDITLTAFTGDPDELAMVYLKRGIEYAKLKDHKKAIDEFSNAIKYGSDEFKKNTFIFYLRGQEYTEIAEYKKSIDDFSESIRLNPAHIKSILMRGNAYFGDGERDKTKADFDEYLRRKKALKNEAQ